MGMKTFDEVVKALSICGRHPDCKGCPYENVSHPMEIGNTCKDIMHYDALYYMQDRIDKYQEANPTSTWQEFWMEEKPMMVESTVLVLNRNMDENEFWQAYRKERK